MKTAGKERESGRCGEVPCEGSFKPIAGSGERGFAGEPPCRSAAGAAPEGRSRGNSSRAFGSLAGTWLSKRRILPCLLPLILFICWNLATSSGLAPEYLLPSPRTVWETVCAYMGAVSEGYADAYAGRFWGDLSASLGRVGSGYLLAVIPGVALGLASGRSPALAPPGTVVAWHRLPGHRVPDRACWLLSGLPQRGGGGGLSASGTHQGGPDAWIRAAGHFFPGRDSVRHAAGADGFAGGARHEFFVFGTRRTDRRSGRPRCNDYGRAAGRARGSAGFGHHSDRAGGVAMRRVAYEGAVGGFGEPEAAVKPFFACSGIWKSFRKGGESRLVLPGVSVAIPRGGVLALIGASGCGKTTLLNILAGFDAPDAGTVTLEGRPCGGPGPDRAVVFQEPALFPWLTALENVEIGLEAAGIPSAARRARALDMLTLTGLSGRENQIPAELSGGQKQRVSLARVLALSPPVLLMDEPFAALDAITREQMQLLLVTLHARIGMGIILVTHDVEEALLLGDEVCVMAPGQGIVASRRVEVPRTGDVTDRKLLRELKTILRQSMAGQGGPLLLS